MDVDVASDHNPVVVMDPNKLELREVPKKLLINNSRKASYKMGCTKKRATKSNTRVYTKKWK